MSRIASFTALAVLKLALAAPVAAQPVDPAAAPPAATRPMDRNDLRRHIYVMEGALARAVEFGARRLNREIRTAMPEMVALSGDPQARGVYLEGYGVYFDVAVPVLNQMMVWSMRTMMGGDGQGSLGALKDLKALAAREKNPTDRETLEAAIGQLELQLGLLAPGAGGIEPFSGAPAAPGAVGATMAAGAAASAGVATLPDDKPRLDRKAFQDPNAVNRAYTESVQNALIDAMIDYSLPMAIRADEFLTVAARDNMQRDMLAPPDPYEEVVTILLRIRGSDLAAYRAGQIDAGEVRRRIQVQEF